MTTQTNSLQSVSERDVAQFLESHLDFFKSHGYLLADLEVPHESGRAVSLVEKQLEVLREQKKHLKKQLQDLIQVARENDQLNQRMHRFILGLLGNDDFDALVRTIYSSLEKEFLVDTSVLWLFDDPQVLDFNQETVRFDSDHWLRKQFEKIIDEVRPVCGRFRDEQLQHLFAAGAEQPVRSAALIPLHDGRPLGLLALGAHDVNRFHASKGTEVLVRLGELVSQVMGDYL